MNGGKVLVCATVLISPNVGFVVRRGDNVGLLSCPYCTTLL